MKAIKKINHYSLVKEIGKGCTSTVYQGVDLNRNHLVAVKMIPMEKFKAGNTEILTKREISLLCSLKHPNIISLRGLERTLNNVYLMLDYCNGGTLKKYQQYYQSKYKSQINEFFVQKIARQLVKGLFYMHSKNTIHRDLKLDNIMLNFNKYPNIVNKGEIPQTINYDDIDLNDDFTIKIVDLGFAKKLSPTSLASSICGTPITMAPDVLLLNEKNKKQYNTKADLWSLGVITYQLLIGQTPFEAKSVSELAEQIKKGSYLLPKEIVLSVEVISFINGLLQFDQVKRMNWEQIMKHPFIVNSMDTFHYINLQKVGDINEKTFEMNTHKYDNYLWLYYMNSSFEMQLDKVNQNEMEKPEVKEMIKHSTIKNKEVIEYMEKDKQLQKQAEEKLKDEKEKENIIQMVSDEEISKMIQELNDFKTNVHDIDNKEVPAELAQADKPPVQVVQTKEQKWKDEYVNADNKTLEKELEQLKEKNQLLNEKIVDKLNSDNIKEDEKEIKKTSYIKEWELLNNPTSQDGYHKESDNKTNIFQKFFYK